MDSFECNDRHEVWKSMNIGVRIVSPLMRLQYPRGYLMYYRQCVPSIFCLYVYVKRYVILLVISFHTDIPTCQERTKKQKTKKIITKIKPKHKKHTHKKTTLKQYISKTAEYTIKDSWYYLFHTQC